MTSESHGIQSFIYHLRTNLSFIFILFSTHNFWFAFVAYHSYTLGYFHTIHPLVPDILTNMMLEPGTSEALPEPPQQVPSPA
jgi:hypothetical protein